MRRPIDEELLQSDLDGAATPEESARVQDLLARRPDLRARYEALRRLARLLGRVGLVEAPPGLAGAVMRAVREKPRPSPSGSWVETLRTAFGRQPALAYGFTLALGLALGVLLTVAAGRSPFPRAFGTSMSGTILPDGLDRLETVDREPFALPGLQGEATTRLGEDRVLVEIRIDSGRATSVVLEFDGSVLVPLGFEGTAAAGEVVLSAHELRLAQAAEGRYVLVLGATRRVPSPVRLELGEGEARFERALKTRREGS